MIFSDSLFPMLQVVLLGDAAHTMSPVFGQGLNSGLEDVAAFAEVLEQHQGNVDTALPAYNTARLPDIQAIMTLNEVVSSKDAGLASTVHMPYSQVCFSCCCCCCLHDRIVGTFALCMFTLHMTLLCLKPKLTDAQQTA